jgi:hypothetical protein
LDVVLLVLLEGPVRGLPVLLALVMVTRRRRRGKSRVRSRPMIVLFPRLALLYVAEELLSLILLFLGSFVAAGLEDGAPRRSARSHPRACPLRLGREPVGGVALDQNDFTRGAPAGDAAQASMREVLGADPHPAVRGREVAAGPTPGYRAGGIVVVSILRAHVLRRCLG